MALGGVAHRETLSMCKTWTVTDFLMQTSRWTLEDVGKAIVAFHNDMDIRQETTHLMQPPQASSQN